MQIRVLKSKYTCEREGEGSTNLIQINCLTKFTFQKTSAREIIRSLQHIAMFLHWQLSLAGDPFLAKIIKDKVGGVFITH